ncbi:MAG: LytTR family DNA-binding domain-containing protein [Bacteroidota bacterium]
MKILIVEDEYHAVKRLKSLIKECRPKAEIVATVDSVEDGVEWLNQNPHPDLAFFDIQLADGLSFDIFRQTKLEIPIIFTTAFNEYAIQAFKVNSVDYLLKPVDEEELANAFQKFDRLQPKTTAYDADTINALMQSILEKNYTERFLIKIGQQLMYLPTSDIAYFYSESSLSFIKTKSNQKHLVDYTLDQLESMLPPKKFFRINRKMIVSVSCIHRVAPYFNSRLVLQVLPKDSDLEFIVSRERSKKFKDWLGA